MSAPLEISLKNELLFIKSLLIPSFNPTNKLDTPEKREEWLETRGVQKKWSLDILTELIERYGTVNSLEKAERLLEKAERLLEKAEENERKQGKAMRHLFSFIVFALIFVILYFHMLLNLCLVLL